MKENICTIPINDLFLPKDGCPFCKMEEMLEKQYVDFVLGDAMMEPSVRIETNKKGFCYQHFAMMYQKGMRLPNALILESHLQEIIDNAMPKKAKEKPDKKQLSYINDELNSCYICDRIEKDMLHLCSTVFVEWSKTPEFRQLYNAQPYICLKHYHFVINTAQQKKGLSAKELPDFYADTVTLCKNYLLSLKADISDFCKMFDYRNIGKDFGKSKDSIERSIVYLTGKKP